MLELLLLLRSVYGTLCYWNVIAASFAAFLGYYLDGGWWIVVGICLICWLYSLAQLGNMNKRIENYSRENPK